MERCVRMIGSVAVSSLLVLTLSSTAQANSITIGGLVIQNDGDIDGDPSPDRILFGQINPGGPPLHWHTTVGQLIFEQVPGRSASLTLTGTVGADGNEVPFEIICDSICDGEQVNISFEWMFAPIGPLATDSASLDGTIVSAAALKTGVELRGFTVAGGFFGSVGPFAGPGAFAGGVGPVPDRFPFVFGLRGDLSFTFGDQVRGDRVQFPDSAVVRTAAPEPGTLALLVSGLAGAIGAARRRRRSRTS